MSNDEYRELLELRVKSYNEAPGSLTGYDCPKCRNKGDYMLLDSEGIECLAECECMQIRRIVRLARKSGLGDVLNEYTFEKYQHEEAWQNNIYQTAQKFIADIKAHCFFIGGQVGAGKSHICTAIVREFINQGVDVHFVIWNDIVTTLKQNIFEDKDRYNNDIEKLKTATVLYIDDMFKTTPTAADIDKAFQIINYRYNQSKSIKDKRFVTIISSEKTMYDLIDIDEAIASRIAELCNRKYYLSINKDKTKNMRFR